MLERTTLSQQSLETQPLGQAAGKYLHKTIETCLNISGMIFKMSLPGKVNKS